MPTPDNVSQLLPGLMSKAEIARTLAVSPRTVDRYTLESGLPFIRIGGKRLFDIEAVAKWAKSKGTAA